MVKYLFELQREFLLISNGYDINGVPVKDERRRSYSGIGLAQGAKMSEVKSFAVRHRYNQNAAHLHLIADTIQILDWIACEDGRPCRFIRESYDLGKHNIKSIPGSSQNVSFNN